MIANAQQMLVETQNGFNTPETQQDGTYNERFQGTADFTAQSDGFSDLNIKYRIYNNNNSSVNSNYEM